MGDHETLRRDETMASPGHAAPAAATTPAAGNRDEVRNTVRGMSYEQGRLQLSPRREGESGGATQSYTVVRGDTLSGIARRFRVPGGYPALARRNGIPDPNRIQVGQVLQIPVPAATTPEINATAPAATATAPAATATAPAATTTTPAATATAPAATATTPAATVAPPSMTPAGETMQAEDPVERAEFESFFSREHVARNQSLGGSGNFDLIYKPSTGVARVEVRLAFDFVAGSVGDMIGAIFSSDEEVGDYIWSEDERVAFQRDFISQVHSVWSGRHPMRCTRGAGTLNHSPSWPSLVANADVNVVLDESNPHFRVRVQRIPRGRFETSSVTAPGRDATGRPTGPGSAEFDSNDVTGVHKASSSPGTTQRATVHEFGHMLGLQDEYAGTGRRAGSTTRQGSRVGGGSNDDRIMAGGEIVEQAHYASIRNALNAATTPVPFDFN